MCSQKEVISWTGIIDCTLTEGCKRARRGRGNQFMDPRFTSKRILILRKWIPIDYDNSADEPRFSFVNGQWAATGKKKTSISAPKIGSRDFISPSSCIKDSREVAGSQEIDVYLTPAFLPKCNLIVSQEIGGFSTGNTCLSDNTTPLRRWNTTSWTWPTGIRYARNLCCLKKSLNHPNF